MKPKVKCEVRPYSAGSDKASVIAVEIYSKLPAINDDWLLSVGGRGEIGDDVRMPLALFCQTGLKA